VFFSELRSQLQKFATLIVRVPVLAMNVVVQEHLQEMEDSKKQKQDAFKEHMEELERRKVCGFYLFAVC